MTEPTISEPAATVPPSDWATISAEYDRRTAELRPGNKASVFDALVAAGLTIVTVTFDGSGDDGQIENIEAKSGGDLAPLPVVEIEIAAAVWGKEEPQRSAVSLRDAIEQLVYDFLAMTHGGWENSDGAYGDVTFDVAARTITLDFNERHMESDYSQHVF
jgi:hypothetical protein